MMTLIEKINGWHPIFLNLAAVAISFTEIEAWLRISVLIITGGYGLWKWRQDYLKSKKK